MIDDILSICSKPHQSTPAESVIFQSLVTILFDTTPPFPDARSLAALVSPATIQALMVQRRPPFSEQTVCSSIRKFAEITLPHLQLIWRRYCQLHHSTSSETSSPPLTAGPTRSGTIVNYLPNLTPQGASQLRGFQRTGTRSLVATTQLTQTPITEWAHPSTLTSTPTVPVQPPASPTTQLQPTLHTFWGTHGEPVICSQSTSPVASPDDEPHAPNESPILTSLPCLPHDFASQSVLPEMQELSSLMAHTSLHSSTQPTDYTLDLLGDPLPHSVTHLTPTTLINHPLGSPYIASSPLLDPHNPPWLGSCVPLTTNIRTIGSRATHYNISKCLCLPKRKTRTANYSCGSARTCTNFANNIECDSNCHPLCLNKILQWKLQLPLLVRPHPILNQELVLMTDASNGAIVCEYTGEIITSAQANKRRRNSTTQPQYCAKFEVILGTNSNKDRTLTEIDASAYGSFARFANHSCSPNAALTIFLTPDGERLALQIKHPGGVKSGTALTIDYGWTYDSSAEPTVCLCRSPNCRGFIEVGVPPPPPSPPPTDSRSIVLNFFKQKYHQSLHSVNQ
jgi:hypothetical protein